MPGFADAGKKLVLALMHEAVPSTSDDEVQALLEACRLVHENLSVYPLPDCVTWAQSESLCNIHSACTARQRAAQRMSFCAVCASNGKGFKGKLRMCCITGKLACVSCQPGDDFCLCVLCTLFSLSTNFQAL